MAQLYQCWKPNCKPSSLNCTKTFYNQAIAHPFRILIFSGEAFVLVYPSYLYKYFIRKFFIRRFSFQGFIILIILPEHLHFQIFANYDAKTVLDVCKNIYVNLVTLLSYNHLNFSVSANFCHGYYMNKIQLSIKRCYHYLSQSNRKIETAAWRNFINYC